ncbi:hypothetical protein [Actinacidiphila acididurans]|uniref:Uncharacterized protein n=1 Tax=Actinacidiphila acididurans TaxID=2784346 RepID=A0ABS2TN25_9ACTN|nr:hypothetical protein [Actinacidiphila acididurans]MBM9504753.1 hypothetical protein [Actinacidiphila acididurans]
MTEGPGQQQPPQDPRSGSAPADGRREVLEGRVIPSRAAQQRSVPDPRRSHGPRQAGDSSWQQQSPPQPPQGQGGPSGPGGQQNQGGYGPGAGGQQQPQPGYGPQGGAQQQGGPGYGQQPPQGPAPFPPQAAAPRTGPGPAAPPASGPGTPDWGALAEEQEASGARRRKVMMLTGGIVAVAVIAGGVATAVVMSGKSSNSASGGPSASASAASTQPLPPEPSFSSVAPPPPANPLDYLGTAAKDKAPLSPATLFPGKQFVMDGRPYVRTADAVTVSCAAGARGTLAQALPANGCRRLIRATYVNGTVAVTIGVAVFDDTAHAKKLQKVAQYVAPLNGGGVRDFCHAVACRMTSNAVGRYAYFAIAGLKDNKTITAQDTVALQAANDASNFAFERIIQRGRDAAAADPARN